MKFICHLDTIKTVSAHLKLVHIGPKHVHIGHFFCSNYPVGSNFGQKFQFFKSLLSPKFNNYSFIIEVKKKILYFIVYPTWWCNIDSISSRVKFVVEFFSSLPYSLNYNWISGILQLLRIWNFCPKLLPTLPHF